MVVERRATAERPDDAGAESDRQAKRKEIKAGIARRAMLLARADALAEKIAEAEAEVRVLTDEHAKRTEPIQAELKRLEEAADKRLRAGKVPDADAERRRADLFGEINAANHDLEEGIEKIRDRQAPVHHERDRLKMEAGGLPREQDLAQPGVGHPKLRLKLFVHQRRLHVLRAREEHARDTLKRLATAREALLREHHTSWGARDVRTIDRRAEEWSAELAAVTEEQQAEIAEGEAIVAELIAE